MIQITHFTTTEGGKFYPADDFEEGKTKFFALRFQDGSIWDRITGWRGKLFPTFITDQHGEGFETWSDRP